MSNPPRPRRTCAAHELTSRPCTRACTRVGARAQRARQLLTLMLLAGSAACASRRGRSESTAPLVPPPGDTSSVDIGGGKSIERLFSGRFPGVSVTPGSNGGLQIRIRGGSNSFMAGEEPLFVVDGTPLPSGTGGVVFLNPYDIEKIEVLKNPADIGLYGLRGANGVVRITTIRPGR